MENEVTQDEIIPEPIVCSGSIRINIGSSPKTEEENRDGE